MFNSFLRFLWYVHSTDVTSGDGIYSGFLTNLSTVTTIYSIRYEVDDNYGASRIDSGEM